MAVLLKSGSSTIFSTGWKKIPFDDLAVLHKFSGRCSDTTSQKPGNLLMSPTFSGNLGKNRCRNTDDVTRNYVREHNKENPKKIGESHKAVERQRNEIPVDNLEFSTFSTGFSTRVFHMEKEWKNGVVINSGRHNLFRLPSTKFYFSGAVHFDQWDLPGRKKALDKEFEEKLKNF